LKKPLSNEILSQIEHLKKTGEIPTHIAIIMDGNGRWAKSKGLPRVAGHRKGIETVREIVKACVNLGVKFLTLYTFSTENWKRPKDEVSTLMRLIVKSLRDETDELHANGIRLTTIGDIDKLPNLVQSELQDAFIKTEKNSKMVLNLALSYSGRWEIVNAVKKIAQRAVENSIKVDDIDMEMISENLTTKNIPDPDLLIRSGGEFRVSNFLLWQIAYSEIFVTSTLWPDFNSSYLIDAVKDFQKRERRFGMVSEQISEITQKKTNAKINK